MECLIRKKHSVEQNSEGKIKLWNINTLLLWQGQFVSVLGDAIYEIALGFWMLALTGSTGLMGTLMAAAIVPRVLIGPFAGVTVDKVDRRRLLIIMDIVRGAVILLVAIAAYNGSIKLWTVFFAQVILGICSAFFNPAINSVLPDIVPRAKLMSANSVFGMLQTGSTIVGSSVGGIIFQVAGAPIMFLFNGLSFLVSGFLQIFIKIPKIERSGEEKHFKQDMREGYLFVWDLLGLRYMLIIFSATNFLVCIVTVLLLPLFQFTESLGPGKYGIFMAFLTAGVFLGMMVIAIVNIPPAKRMKVFMVCSIISGLCFILVTLTENFPVMAVLIFIGGAFASICDLLIFSTIQLIIPQNMRGKVFALIGTVVGSLTPVGMALGGVLGEFFPIRTIIFTCMLIDLLLYISFAFVPSFKRFINFDPEKETLEDMAD